MVSSSHHSVNGPTGRPGAKPSKVLLRRAFSRIVTWFRDWLLRKTYFVPKLIENPLLREDFFKGDQLFLPEALYPYREVIFSPPPLFSGGEHEVLIYHSAHIVGHNPVAFTSERLLIQEALFRNEARNHLALKYLRAQELAGLFLRSAARTAHLSGKVCLLASFWDNFGHWIPEHLLKVKALAEGGHDLSEITFVVREDTPGYKSELLQAVGIQPGQIYRWTGEHILVDQLLVPIYPQISQENLHWVSGLIPNQPSPIGSHYRGVYLSRQSLGRRNISNEEEILHILREFGIVALEPQRLSLGDQVALVRGAELLFGPQGSAFTLQLFMRSASLVEVFPRDRVHLFNRQVANVLGHEHFSMGDARGPRRKGFGDASVWVNPRELRFVLEAALRLQRNPIT